MSTFTPTRRQTTGRHVHPGLALAVIAGAQLMVVLDATIVNIALPHIQSALGFSNTSLAWVLNAYTLTFGGLLLLGGRTGDLFGRRRMFMIGVVLFAAASLVGGFAQSQEWLLVTRALQGVGGAIASPTALALVTTAFDEGPARNRAFGVYAAVSGAGAAVGLILGGVLTDALSWRWVLFVNAPIGVLLALAAPYVIPESERSSGRLDLPGALLSTAGMASLTYGFIHAASSGWRTGVTLASFAVAVVLLAAFVVGEARNRQPLMPLRLFRSSDRVGSYAVMLIVGAAVFAMFFFLTQFVQEILGFSPLKAGFAFLPVSAAIVVVAQVASRLVTTVGPRRLIVAGTVATAGGLVWLAQLTTSSTYLTGVLAPIMVLAMGMGLVFVPITLTAVSGVDSKDSGIASAMLNVGQQVGGTLGLSALITVYSSAFTAALPPAVRARVSGGTAHSGGSGPLPPFVRHALVSGWDEAFLAAAIFAAAGAVVALLLIRTGAKDAAAAGVQPGSGLG